MAYIPRKLLLINPFGVFYFSAFLLINKGVPPQNRFPLCYAPPGGWCLNWTWLSKDFQRSRLHRLKGGQFCEGCWKGSRDQGIEYRVYMGNPLHGVLSLFSSNLADPKHQVQKLPGKFKKKKGCFSF